MGASVALAARERGDGVAGWDPEPAALAAAVQRGAIEPSGSLEDAVAGADLVVVAAPIAQLPGQVAATLAATTDATVTDVGSTKASAVAAAAGSPRFVGGPPSCGAAARGARDAGGGLFQGATGVRTPWTHTHSPPPPRRS